MYNTSPKWLARPRARWSLPAPDVGPGDEAELPGGGRVRPQPALHRLVAQVRVEQVAPLQGQVVRGLGLEIVGDT